MGPSASGRRPRFSLAELDEAAARVHDVLPATPLLSWPLLSERLGLDVRVKHESHLPTGAFKVRGGVYQMTRLRAQGVTRVVAATRGNHGQSVAYAARRLGMSATIVVPFGNSPGKNAAMRGFGAELVEHGHDFQAALEHARALSDETGAVLFPSFSIDLVRGVASYALEMFREVEDLEVVYVPIGMGSGICGVLAARDALGLGTEVVGVVAEGAPAYALSFIAGHVVPTERADTMADGLACRTPDPLALTMILEGADRIVTVTDDEIQTGMRILFTDTHHVAEGAAGAALAAVMQEREKLRGRRIAVVLSGSNVDREPYLHALGRPEPGSV